MKAAVLAVGTELLGTDRLDTNSLEIAATLERYGAELVRKVVVGDDEPGIALELGRLAADVELILVTGGLGPTRDDLTRRAAARFCGRQLYEDAAVLARIEAGYRRYGRAMPDSNRRQAEVIEGAEVLQNPVGTAPGLRLSHRGTEVFLFPGVPRELLSMIESVLEPWLAERAGSLRRGRVELRTASMPESAIEDLLQPVYEQIGREEITVLARPGEVRVRLSASGEREELRAELELRRDLVLELLGDCVFSTDDRELEEVVIDELCQRALTVSVAESCTGGLIGERLTRVPGSSAAFVGGGIVYSNRLKISVAGVAEELLRRHGAVSEQVARALAEGARRIFATDLALAVTGIAGPDGGTEEKPVGLVHLAVADQGTTDHLEVRFPGDRERIRYQSSQLALEMLRRRLLGLEAGTFWTHRPQAGEGQNRVGGRAT